MDDKISFDKKLEQRYQDLFGFTEKTVKKSRNFLVGEKPDTLGKKITLFHFARAAYLLDAIYRLCNQGFATEAMVILRSLLNLYINIKWLTSSNTAERLERFVDFGAVYEALALDRLAERRGLKANFHPHREFELVKKKYGLKRRSDFFRWSGKSIKQMAKDVNLDSEYDGVYSHLSAIEHTGPESAADYVEHPQGKILIKAGPRDNNIRLVLLTALKYYFFVEGITRGIFGADCSPLEKDTQEWSVLSIKYLSGVTVKISDSP
jgi:hypothetical protein